MSNQEERKHLPGILVCTLPKSGSVYLINAFSTGLGVPSMKLAPRWWPRTVVFRDRVMRLAEGGVYAQQHLPAFWENKAVLNRYVDKMVVHVRDPRSSTLEWAYHLLTLRATDQPDGLTYTSRRYLPDGYFSMPLSDQIDVQIDNYLPDAIEWIEGWVDAAEDQSFRTEVLLVQYEDFVKDEMAYFYRILDFYGIDRALWRFEPFLPKKADNPLHEGEFHYRNARTDEWRDVFTPEQADKASKMMPGALLARFGWPTR